MYYFTYLFFISVWFMSGFCHFGLVYSWFCDRALIPVMSCFHVFSRLHTLFRIGAWCSDPGTYVLSFGFMSGFGHSRSVFCHWEISRSRVRSTTRSPVHVCFIVVARSSCFYRLRAMLHLYLVAVVARSLCISLAACFMLFMSCVKHVACEFSH